MASPSIPYYDHDPAYARRRALGLTAWDPPTQLGVHDALDEFLTSAHFPATGRLLDMGCGGGGVSIRLRKLGWSCRGLEYSQVALAMARDNAARAGVECAFEHADLAAPVSSLDGSFDLAIDNHVLHCLVDPHHRRAFLANAYAALRPGGVFFSASMSAEGHVDYEKHGISRATRIAAGGTRFFARRCEIEAAVTAVGFRLLHVAIRQCPPEESDCGDEVVIYARR